MNSQGSLSFQKCCTDYQLKLGQGIFTSVKNLYIKLNTKKILKSCTDYQLKLEQGIFTSVKNCISNQIPKIFSITFMTLSSLIANLYNMDRRTDDESAKNNLTCPLLVF